MTDFAFRLSGATYQVTDAASPSYNGTLTGDGSTKVIAYCNGSAWTAASFDAGAPPPTREQWNQWAA